MIAFLGMGLLGSNFVRALRRRGEEVHVWNRTPERARALEHDGAVAFDDPADAVRHAARIHLTLSDDAAVDAVLDRSLNGLSPGAVIVDHTTTSPSGTAARAARWTERDIGFQHAPVFMGPKNALEGSGFMMASGDHARFEELRPALEQMTGHLAYVGPQPERAACLKLLGNLFLMAMTAGFVDMLALARDLDVPADDVASLFDWFNPGATVPARFRRVLTAEYDKPSWTLAMARKDARLMLESAHGGMPLAFLPVIAAAMDRWVEAGAGGKDWTVIGHDVVAAT